MIKLLRLNCPHCNEVLVIKINLTTGEVLSVKLDNAFFNTNEEVKEILNKMGIEFG